MILDEKTYLFNPFNIQKVTDEAISEQIDAIALKYIQNADTPYDVANNIDVGSNILYLYGELISRFTSRYQSLKLANDKDELLETHRLRKEWSINTKEKAPAISYFEAQAVNKYEQSRNREFKYLENLTRFKYAYSSLESRVNAWKKKLETFKYEIGV